MSRRRSGAVLVFGAWLAAACGDPPVAPLTTADVTGTFALTDIDGRAGPWPPQWPPSPGNVAFLAGDTLVLRPDGALGGSVIYSDDASGRTTVVQLAGRWRVGPGARELTVETSRGNVAVYEVVGRGAALRAYGSASGRGLVWTYTRAAS